MWVEFFVAPWNEWRHWNYGRRAAGLLDVNELWMCVGASVSQCKRLKNWTIHLTFDSKWSIMEAIFTDPVLNHVLNHPKSAFWRLFVQSFFCPCRSVTSQDPSQGLRPRIHCGWLENPRSTWRLDGTIICKVCKMQVFHGFFHCHWVQHMQHTSSPFK